MRDPDGVFEKAGQARVIFEDVTERLSLKLTSLLRLSAQTHWELFQESVIHPRVRATTGLTAIIYRMELETKDVPIDFRTPLDVTARITLCRAGEGEETRIISRGEMELSAVVAKTKERAIVGRSEIHHVFTKLLAPPPERRVTKLDPVLGFSKEVPERAVDYLKPEDVLRPPEGFSLVGKDLHDGEPHVWPFANTDPNQHVHAMDYVAFGSNFAADQMARLERSPKDYYFTKARIIYRRPFFTGDNYHRVGNYFEHTSGEGAVQGCFLSAFYRTAGAPPPEERPAVALQLFTLPKPRGGIPPDFIS